MVEMASLVTERRFGGLISSFILCILLILSKTSGKYICKKLAVVCDGVSEGCSSERTKNWRRMRGCADPAARMACQSSVSSRFSSLRDPFHRLPG